MMCECPLSTGFPSQTMHGETVWREHPPEQAYSRKLLGKKRLTESNTKRDGPPRPGGPSPVRQTRP